MFWNVLFKSCPSNTRCDIFEESGKRQCLRDLGFRIIINSVFLVDELSLINVAIRASGERSSSTTRLNTLFPRSFQISAKRRGAYWKEDD